MWTNEQKELHYVNVGKSRLTGVEALCKIRIDRHLNLHGAYNYLYTGKDAGGVRLSSSSPHSGTVRAEYNTRVPRFSTVINLSGTIMGKKNFDVLGELEINGRRGSLLSGQGKMLYHVEFHGITIHHEEYPDNCGSHQPV